MSQPDEAAAREWVDSHGEDWQHVDGWEEAFLAGAAHGRADQQEADNKLRSAAEILLYQIERAGGLLKLSNAVELGATSWLVHTLDAFERIEDAIRADKPETT